MKEPKSRKPRLSFSENLTVFVDEHQGSIRNVSESGCLIASSSWFRVDLQPRELTISPDSLDPFLMTGKIVRAKMVPKKEGIAYELGFKFDSGGPSYTRFRSWLKLQFERDARRRIYRVS